MSNCFVKLADVKKILCDSCQEECEKTTCDYQAVLSELREKAVDAEPVRHGHMDILNEAIYYYGERNQIIVAIEELSELQKELCKYLRGDGNHAHLTEEMADVFIMLEQLQLMFDNDDDIEEIKRYKLERLDKRIHPIKCPTCGITMDEKQDVCPVCGRNM